MTSHFSTLLASYKEVTPHRGGNSPQFKGGLAVLGGTENQIFDGNERDPDLETQPVFLESVLFIF